MRSPLSAAFRVGVAPFQHIANFYDRAGFFAMRALIDDGFITIRDDDISSPHLRKAADLFNKNGGLLQEKLFKGIADTYAGGNVGPKPDFKKPLLRIGEILLSNVSRMNVGQAAIITLSVGAGLAAMYIANHTGITNHIPDAASAYLGLKPNSTPIPTQDAL